MLTLEAVCGIAALMMLLLVIARQAPRGRG